MGCFLACFGFKELKKKKKRPGKKRPLEEQDHQNYVPLDSDVLVKLDINSTSDSDHLKEKQKEATIQKIKKKVRFNLNVKAYEPIPHNYDDDDDLEDTKWEFNSTENKNMNSLHYEEEDIIASSCISTRYQNCRDSYDEEDEELMMIYDDADEIEDNDDDDDDDNDVQNDEEDFPWVKSGYNDGLPETSVDQLVERKSNVRDRSKYVYSVLNAVENVSQWKAVKAKGVTPPQYMCQKENLMS